MCGRYASYLPPEAVARIFRTVSPVPNIAPNWNVAPTQPALAVRRHPESGARHLDVLSWGLLPFFTKEAKGAKRPINARAETIATSGMFRESFARRRCLIPADAFYEWQARAGAKQAMAIARVDGAPMAFGGIWDRFRGADGKILRSFAIVTTTANATLSAVHERMPVVLEEAAWPVWLGETEGDAAALMRPADDDVLRFWPVGPGVNKVANNTADLLAPGAETPSP
jgi:putative SOS response-associated peptidase YedK